MYKKTIQLITMSLVLFLFSCSNKECDCIEKLESKKISTEYKNLVNEATICHLGKYYSNTIDNETYLDSALYVLNQAIELSPDLFPAYYFKSLVLNTKGDYYSTVETIDSATNKTYSNPDMLFLKAKALDHLKRTAQADAVLEKAETLYNQWIECFPDSINLIAAAISFTAYYKGREASLEEIDRYLKKYPNNELLMGYKDVINNEPNESEFFRNHRN